MYLGDDTWEQGSEGFEWESVSETPVLQVTSFVSPSYSLSFHKINQNSYKVIYFGSIWDFFLQ